MAILKYIMLIFYINIYSCFNSFSISIVLQVSGKRRFIIRIFWNCFSIILWGEAQDLVFFQNLSSFI